jgi:hypothetical protein
MVFPIVNGLLELRKYSRKYVIFLLCISHIQILQNLCSRTTLLLELVLQFLVSPMLPQQDGISLCWQRGRWLQVIKDEVWLGVLPAVYEKQLLSLLRHLFEAFLSIPHPANLVTNRLISWFQSQRAQSSGSPFEKWLPHASNRKFPRRRQIAWSMIQLMITVWVIFSSFCFCYFFLKLSGGVGQKLSNRVIVP